jgi:hypothetical protein
MAETHKGSCFCGTVEIQASGVPLEMGYCHCKACRAYSGGPLNAFTLWPKEGVKVIKGEEFLGGFQKTEFSLRRFCTKCGGHVLVEHPGMGLTDVYAGLFPTLAFKPTVHLNYESTILRIKDGLPKLKDFPVAAGGTGETLPE